MSLVEIAEKGGCYMAENKKKLKIIILFCFYRWSTHLL